MAKKLTSTQNDVIDISLSSIRKKRFRIDGDDSRILELDTSDLGILSRLQETYPKLQKLNEKAVEDWSKADKADEQDYSATVTLLTDIDTEMRKLIDYIFDSNVSEVCVPTGTMYDPINGQFRFEYIISCLSTLYETNISAETKKLSERVQKYTSKYTGK